MKTIFVITMLLAVLSSSSQNCFDTSYKKLLSSPGSILNSNQYILNKDGSSILIGSVIDLSTYDTSVNVIKLSSAGTIEWSKKVTMPNDFLSYGSLSWEATILSNTDIVLLLKGSISNGLTLIKFSSSGNLVWVKRVLPDNTDYLDMETARLYLFGNDLWISCMAQQQVDMYTQLSGNTILKLILLLMCC
ncbi:hypothetical protein [Ferruginibacter albus]|uniref:hypothetical protein n=1 Tax=Ferruginibacter albus TaxID=2875540 RepID=UPI001CC78FFD|nr:hypothetical protein [Ferruginibacter albus]UAY52427.1 hypothetical protein K9M53_01745 [Ferruginibacter albus]